MEEVNVATGGLYLELKHQDSSRKDANGEMFISWIVNLIYNISGNQRFYRACAQMLVAVLMGPQPRPAGRRGDAQQLSVAAIPPAGHGK